MIEPWQELSREEVFRKYTRRIQKVMYRLPSGDVTDFYIRDEGRVVAVLALTEENKVILAKQFRPGPQKVLLEMPGGVCDPLEEPLEAMRRELLEETGYEGEITFAAKCHDDTYSNLVRYFFVAKNCMKIKEIDTSNPTEQIELELLTLEEFRALLRSGEMTDVEAGYLCLDYLGLL